MARQPCVARPWGKLQVYRASRQLAAIVATVTLLGVLIPWEAQRPEVQRPSEPELETDTSDATQNLVSPAGTSAPQPLTEPTREFSRCPEGMVYVRGDYCPGLAHICKAYIDERLDRCREFVPTSRCLGPTYVMEFCIDQYEYPNRFGVLPLLAVDWNQARDLCAAGAKRLCSAAEWTLACEGDGRLPYPYGYVRDSEACNIDKPYIIPNDGAYTNRSTREAEIARLDQREPSGHRPGCVSPYGVFDMTGNVDEWIQYEKGSLTRPPYTSALKGGYWGPVRNRCRPITATHNRWHTGYQIGLRCCRSVDPPNATGDPPPSGFPPNPGTRW